MKNLKSGEQKMFWRPYEKEHTALNALQSTLRGSIVWTFLGTNKHLPIELERMMTNYTQFWYKNKQMDEKPIQLIVKS